MSNTYRSTVQNRLARSVKQIHAARLEAGNLACEVPTCTRIGSVIQFTGLADLYCPVYCAEHQSRVS